MRRYGSDPVRFVRTQNLRPDLARILFTPRRSPLSRGLVLHHDDGQKQNENKRLAERGRRIAAVLTTALWVDWTVHATVVVDVVVVVTATGTVVRDVAREVAVYATIFLVNLSKNNMT
jgi:hypothetical protein